MILNQLHIIVSELIMAQVQMKSFKVSIEERLDSLDQSVAFGIIKGQVQGNSFQSLHWSHMLSNESDTLITDIIFNETEFNVFELGHFWEHFFCDFSPIVAHSVDTASENKLF